MAYNSKSFWTSIILVIILVDKIFIKPNSINFLKQVIYLG